MLLLIILLLTTPIYSQQVNLPYSRNVQWVDLVKSTITVSDTNYVNVISTGIVSQTFTNKTINTSPIKVDFYSFVCYGEGANIKSPQLGIDVTLVDGLGISLPVKPSKTATFQLTLQPNTTVWYAISGVK